MLNLLFLLALETSLPNVEVDRICHGAASASLPEDASRAQKSCQDDETSARETLRSHWAGYPAAAKNNCASSAGMQFSYVELLTCLQIQDPSKFEKDPGPGLKLAPVAPIIPTSPKS